MKTKIEFFSETTQTTETRDCLLHLSVSGTKESIRQKLFDLIDAIDSDYGKPIQGYVSAFKSDSHVITPIWGGREY